MPSGTALFSNSSSRNQSKNLVEFKAGKMTMKGKMVHADKRKGLVYIHQSDDSLMHFCWKDRTTSVVEDDLIIFPDDVEFKRVPQCTTGRVYILKFKSSNRKFFFWVQEPKTDKDEENCRKVNDVLNNPPILSQGRSGGATPDSDLQNLLNNMSQQQLMQLFGGVGQMSGLSSLLGSMNQSSGGGGGSSSTAKNSSSSTAAATPASSTPASAPSSTPATTASSTAAASTASSTALPLTPKTPASPSSRIAAFTTPQAPKKGPSSGGVASSGAVTPGSTPSAATGGSQAATSAADPIMLSQLQRYLSNLGVQSPASGTSSPGAGGTPLTGQPPVDLSSAVTPESLQSVLKNPEFVAELQRHLPPSLGGGSGGVESTSPGGPEQLRTTLQSPQFQQALSLFSEALQSGQLGPMVSQFNMGEGAVSAANSGNMEEFIRALQEASISQARGGGGTASTETEGNSESKDEKKKKNDDEDMALD